MKRIKILYPLISLLAVMILGGCNDFLDEMPDNRAEIDSEEKVIKLLVSAYPDRYFATLTEISSDNVDDNNADNPMAQPEYIECFFLEEADQISGIGDDIQALYNNTYRAIAASNMALDAIAKLPDSRRMQSAKGEALIARAYNHFILINMFSQHYSDLHSANDLGMPYMEELETTLLNSYPRGNVADFYEKIEKDITDGLPLVSDDIYTVPKYHFNVKAANAFAARFYLYYGKWAKVIEHADLALGAEPKLHDWETYRTLPLNQDNVRENFWTRDDHPFNLMVKATYSMFGAMQGSRIFPYNFRFSWGTYINRTELLNAPGPWGDASDFIASPSSSSYPGYAQQTKFQKVPDLFQYTDPIAQTGYFRTKFVPFNTDETLLCRAEAYAHLHDYEAAVRDLNIWKNNFCKPTVPDFTVAGLVAFYSGINYWDINAPTVKKKLNPDFELIEGSTHENIIHAILHIRRIQTMQEGLRWFDVKRYNIEIYKRLVEAWNGDRVTPYFQVEIRDKRFAFQIPPDVRNAGMEPNPR